jgi:hypothetical protein
VCKAKGKCNRIDGSVLCELMIDVLKIDTFISGGCFYICCHFHICTIRSDVKRSEYETVIRTRYSNDIFNLFNNVLQLHGLGNVEWKDEEIGVMLNKAASRKTCLVYIGRFS